MTTRLLVLAVALLSAASLIGWSLGRSMIGLAP